MVKSEKDKGIDGYGEAGGMYMKTHTESPYM